jgi:hypothetical protein
MSLVASTRGVALLPGVRNFLPWSVVSRPLEGDDQPTVDLVVGFNRTNGSPILKLFLSRLDALIVLRRPKSPDDADSAGGGLKPALTLDAQGLSDRATSTDSYGRNRCPGSADGGAGRLPVRDQETISFV